MRNQRFIVIATLLALAGWSNTLTGMALAADKPNIVVIVADDLGNADQQRPKNGAGKNPDVVKDLESRLLAYAKQQKMSEWLKVQIDYLGFQGETVLDPYYSTDGGLPTEKPALPKKRPKAFVAYIEGC